MTETAGPLSAKFIEACGQLDIKNTESVISAVRALDKISPELAKNEHAR
jgi:hypothetical protein